MFVNIWLLLTSAIQSYYPRKNTAYGEEEGMIFGVLKTAYRYVVCSTKDYEAREITCQKARDDDLLRCWRALFLYQT